MVPFEVPPAPNSQTDLVIDIDTLYQAARLLSFSSTYDPLDNLRQPNRLVKHDQSVCGESLVRTIAAGAIEVFAGSRDIRQLGTLLNDRTYYRLRESVRGKLFPNEFNQAAAAQNGHFEVSSVRIQQPSAERAEAVVLVKRKHQTRVVTLSLEFQDNRWLACDIGLI